MKTNEKNIEVLSDLIRINTDRAAAYERIVKEFGNSDQHLKSVFKSFAAESNTYTNELSRYIIYSGGKLPEANTVAGKIYKEWLNAKSVFTGKDLDSVLTSCELSEEIIQNVYKQALQSEGDNRLTPDVRHAIERQKKHLKHSQDNIKRLRNTQPI